MSAARVSKKMKPTTSRQNLGRLIEQLAESVDVADVAEKLGLVVKRSGGRPMAQCIFHDDTNPSMSLYPATQKDKSHFHCFVCNSHGDIFELVKKAKGLNFVDSVRWLASSYGYAHSLPEKIRTSTTVPDLPSSTDPANSTQSELEQALSIYRRSNSEKLASWLQTREISRELAKSAEVCFSEPRVLVRQLGEELKAYGTYRQLLDRFESAGLIRKKMKSQPGETAATYLDLGADYSDFFFDERVIFPIRDLRKKLVGFAGRKISDTSDTPKYLYTPNLPKSNLLYRAHYAFEVVRSDVNAGNPAVIYLCEGLLDALRLEAFGFAAVAVLGSRISENQARTLTDFASTLPDLNPLTLRIFLDRDAAGLKGAAGSIEVLLKVDPELRLQLSFLWPSTPDAKDPDELLKPFHDRKSAQTALDAITYPAGLALLAEKLNVPPTDILSDTGWATIPLGAKYRLAHWVAATTNGLLDRLLGGSTHPASVSSTWIRDIRLYVSAPPQKLHPTNSNRSSYENTVRLNLARELAQSGAKCEVHFDVAGWRRISLAATAFNVGFQTRLQQAQFQSTEPFEAIHVSRGFGKSEARLKATPCPEDLIIQQYVLNEILTDRLDDGSEHQFSNHIPAVRYYRSTNNQRTTGEHQAETYDETLSFAYQIDMDVLEGKSPPSESGIFRPYFECWRGFISSLLAQGARMEHVHMIRLDLKRYYDKIKRSVVRDLLRDCLKPAYHSLQDPDQFAPLFRPNGLLHERENAVIDFVVEQSFGFTYYAPDNGTVLASDREQGIPQGPVLSAWIGNMVLFKLDTVLRAKLHELNRQGVVRAGYGRYVDDVVLLSDSVDTLDALRALTEDVVRNLQLEVIAKESFAPMSNEEFLLHLTSGRALPASGPREEAVLLESGDGDAGWGMWQSDEPRRYTSLELLRDARLYSAPPEVIENQIFTALRAEDLRPAELGKAARWLWFHAAVMLVSDDYDVEKLFATYWRTWRAVCSNAPSGLHSDLAWDDPAFYALEGLENLLERANSSDFGLTPEEAQLRIKSIGTLAKTVISPEFVDMFLPTEDGNAPAGWGKGAAVLRRMFFQRLISIRWKAAQLSDDSSITFDLPSVRSKIEGMSDALQGSLKRALFTEAETCRTSGTGVAVSGQGSNERNPLSDAFLWLHQVVVALYTDPTESQLDPLAAYVNELRQIQSEFSNPKSAHFSVVEEKFLPLLQGLLPENQLNLGSGSGTQQLTGEVVLLSLQTLAAISPRGRLAHLLSKREHLIQGDERKLPLPPLPGVPATGLLLVTIEEGHEYWAPINKVWWVTLPASGEFSAKLPSFKLASSSGEARIIELDWQKVEQWEKLEVFCAAWNSNTYPSLALIQSSTVPVDAINLRWIADAFEAIARLNFDSEIDMDSEDNEYVPAWPYLVVNRKPGTNGDEAVALTLLTPKYSSRSLDGTAFIRDGARGLRTYEVPDAYGRHWRTGVLFSDLFGYRRDSDQFASLRAQLATDQDASENTSPAKHLLRNILRKLRGVYTPGGVLRPQRGREHVPATIGRSLDTLRRFPSGDTPKEQVAYVLASESESAAMHLRIADYISLQNRGIPAAYLERIALRVVGRIPLTWSEFLLAGNTSRRSPTRRVIPKSYFELADRIEGLASESRMTLLDRASLALVAGLRLCAVSAWLRELTLCVEMLGDEDDWSLPINGDVSNAWKIEESGFLFTRPEEPVSGLTTIYHSHIQENGSQQAFMDITPLGWLTLLAGRVGLLGGVTKRRLLREWDEEDLENVRKLAAHLSFFSAGSSDLTDEVHPDWPYELLDSSGGQEWLLWPIHELVPFINSIEKNLGLKLNDSISGPWRFDPTDSSFTDLQGERWAIKRWQILLTRGARPERIAHERRLQNVWDETRDAVGRLLVVSARDDRLGKLLSAGKINDTAQEDFTGEVPIGRYPGALEFAEGSITQTRAPNLHPGFEITSGTSAGGIVASEGTKLPPSSPPTDLSSLSGRKSGSVQDEWRSFQAQSWRQRRQRSPGHIRIAIMQWDLAETYHHPVIETAKWEEVWPPREPPLSFENSTAERRRRLLISSALAACADFEVDLLVLPEYSVRPDTVAWLRKQLERRSGAPSVLAGTYKLHGNLRDHGFDQVHREILGLADYHKVIGAGPGAHSPSTHSSGEQSAILTLLTPLELSDNKRIVCTFTRRKKYPSLAASEVFNPPLETLAPLYSPEKLLNELEARNASGSRAFGAGVVSARMALDCIEKLRSFERMAEFVCSELFLPMSLANHHTLATELRKLALRFGSLISLENALDNVLSDIREMAGYLGVGSKRRSILIVPAMTTRSADYWIFGQAALLSGGSTTVFCNAVVTPKGGVGGSCFVGRNSWKREGGAPYYDTNSMPYAGWSKGIYYNQKSDALGAREQAVVIADIDATFMQEGKPRPQALAIPLQLVSYLPIVEMTKEALDFQGKLGKFIKSTAHIPMAGHIVSPHHTAFAELAELLSMSLENRDEGSFRSRFEHWKKYWKVNPVAGIPPALVDWLWVDAEDSVLESKVFVPNFSGEDISVSAAPGSTSESASPP